MLKTWETSEQLSLLKEFRPDSTSLRSAFHARIYQWQADEAAFMRDGAGYFLRLCKSLKLPAPQSLSLKTSKDSFHREVGETLRPYCEQLPTLGFMTANGNCLIHAGFYPKIENASTLSDILEENLARKYFLSQKTIRGFLTYNGSFRGRFKPKDETDIADTLTACYSGKTGTYIKTRGPEG